MGKLWTRAEDDQLMYLTGDMPWSMVVTSMRRLATINGWPERTPRALLWRAEQLGLSLRCVGQWVSIKSLAKTLRVHHSTVRSWIQEGDLTDKPLSNTRWISRASLRRLAKRRPAVFAGMSESELFQLLDSEELAAKIAAMNLKRRRMRQPVICVETGWHYPTITAAAAAWFVAPGTIHDALRRNGTAGGKHWRRA